MTKGCYLASLPPDSTSFAPPLSLLLSEPLAYVSVVALLAVRQSAIEEEHEWLALVGAASAAVVT